MKVVSWNLGAAFGAYVESHDRAWNWLAAVDPDSLLGRFGSYPATAFVRVRDVSLLVASVHTRAAVAPEWATAGFDRAAMARKSVGEPWSNDVAFAGYRDLVADRRFLVGGDWNTGLWADENGRLKPDGVEFLDRAEAAGWKDVSLIEEGRTWYGFEGIRPYQPDHVFADELTAYHNRTRSIDTYPVKTLELSDHAPLVLDLGVVQVDSGTLLVGDPLYALPSAEGSRAGMDYQAVIDADLGGFAAPFADQPVLLIGRFGGDGAYGVFGEFSEGELVRLVVDFDPLAVDGADA